MRRPRTVHTSVVKKSAASSGSQCAPMKVRHAIGRSRPGGMPPVFKVGAIVERLGLDAPGFERTLDSRVFRRRPRSPWVNQRLNARLQTGRLRPPGYARHLTDWCVGCPNRCVSDGFRGGSTSSSRPRDSHHAVRVSGRGATAINALRSG